jgi:hypothetical protein
MEIQTPTLRQKVKKELSEYFINVAFLALFFCTYAFSRRLTLAEYGIYLDDYFVGLIKALVIGKVIMMASFLRISKLFEDRPLIVPILYKVLIFALCAIMFDVLEGLIKGMISTSSFSGGFGHVADHHFSKMWMGGVLFVTVSFIPFFALKELSRLVGHEKFRDFLLKGPALRAEREG